LSEQPQTSPPAVVDGELLLTAFCLALASDSAACSVADDCEEDCA
jgi:hypothetical protein